MSERPDPALAATRAAMAWAAAEGLAGVSPEEVAPEGHGWRVTYSYAVDATKRATATALVRADGSVSEGPAMPDPFPVGEGLEIVGCAPWGGNVMARLSNGARLEVPPESPCRPEVGVELTVARGWDPVRGVALVDGHGRALWYVTANRAEWAWP